MVLKYPQRDSEDGVFITTKVESINPVIKTRSKKNTLISLMAAIFSTRIRSITGLENVHS